MKWPNDIYANHDGKLKKLGGILVNSEYQYESSSFLVTIGCGLNVLNSKPSVCLQDLTTRNIELEKVLANILIEFNNLYDEMVEESSSLDCFAGFRARYYTSWLHTNQIVNVRDNTGKETRARIQGLDRMGYLEAKSLDSDSIISLQPDGNSFDMLKNLITVKV